MISRVMCTLEVTTVSKELLQTIWNHLQLNEKLLCFGELQELESLEELGKKPRFKRIQKILGLNFGMATEVKKMLLSMNSVEELMSHTYSDGSIDIQLLLKSKDPVSFSPQKRFGSPQIWTHENGSPSWTSVRRKLF